MHEHRRDRGPRGVACVQPREQVRVDRALLVEAPDLLVGLAEPHEVHGVDVTLDGLLPVGELDGDLLGAAESHAGQQIVVTAEVLGGAVDHVVGAVGERALIGAAIASGDPMNRGERDALVVYNNRLASDWRRLRRKGRSGSPEDRPGRPPWDRKS